MHTPITYRWSTLSIWEIIASFFPYHGKRYVLKWIQYRNDWVQSIVVGRAYNDTDIQIMLTFKLDKNHTFLDKNHTFIFDSTRWCNPTIAYGMSFRVAWENMLNNIAELENMKNAEELCIWLDMKDL